MKKALSVALACSMALSLVACGGGSKPTEAPTTAAAGDTTTEAAADTTRQRHRKQAQRWQTRISL